MKGGSERFNSLKRCQFYGEYMKFKLEDVIQEKELNASGYNKGALPSVADNFRKDYYKRPRLTLRERWELIRRDACYPLSHF